MPFTARRSGGRSMFKTFEQTSCTGFARRLLMMMVSIVAHAVAIFVLVVLPLLFFNVLPERDLLTWLTAAPAPPAPTPLPVPPTVQKVAAQERSEEHTSELQSRFDLV